MVKKIQLLLIGMFLCIPMFAVDGDTFFVTTENEVAIQFTIISEEQSTVKVGDSTNSAVDASLSGTIMIPANVTYNEKSYKVTAIANKAFYNCANITEVIIPDVVSSIGAYAFYGCKKMTTITIPEGVTAISNYSFQGCAALSTVNLPSTIKTIGSYAFNSCKALRTIDLPDALTTIKDHSFESSALRTLVIPANVTVIQTYAFNANYSLSKVISRVQKPFSFGALAFFNMSSSCGLHVPAGTKAAYISKGWNSSVFKGGVVEGDDTPTLGFTFKVATEEGVEIPYIVYDVDNWYVKIGDGSKVAIDASTSGTISIPETVNYGECTYHVKNISAKAFTGCTGLNKVVLPASLVSIGSQAFYGCTSLNGVYARMNPPFALESNAFTNISNYCGLHVPEGTKVDYMEAGWTKEVFKGGVVEGDDALTGGFKFKKTNNDGIEITYVIVDIDELTVQVGDDSSSAIPTSVSGTCNIPSTVEYEGVTYNVTTIGNNAFAGCSELIDVVLPEGLKSISTNAFNGCTNIMKVTLPSSLTNIASNGFKGCSSLTKVIARMENPFSLNATAFSGIASTCGLHVPDGKKTAYIEAGWTASIFKGGVVEGDDTPTIGYTFTVPTEEGLELTYFVTNVDNMTVKVGNSTNTAISTDATGSVTIPATVECNGLIYQVTTIAAHAFDGCAGITTVTIPEGVTIFGDYAFAGCKALKTVQLPETLTNINQYAFSNCKALKTIDLPNSLKTIGAHAFESSALTKLELPENVTSIGTYAFNANYSLSKVISHIQTPFTFGGLAFFNNAALCSLHVPEGTKDSYIAKGWTKSVFKGGIVEGENTLAGGDTFTLTDENGVEIVFTVVDVDNMTAKVGDGKNPAVSTSTTAVKIPETATIEGQTFTVTSIGEKSFNGCKQLASISLPESITSIEPYAFNETEALTSINIPTSVNSIGSDAFSYSGLKSIIIPEGVTSIEMRTFADCYFLNTVTLPNTLKSIGMQAFRHNLRLTSVNLPEGLTSMNAHAFYNCQSLNEITLPSTLTNCKSNGFYYCVSLTKVIARMEDPFKLPTQMFDECSSNLSLHIPDGTYDKYAAAGWVPEIFSGGIVYGDDTPTLNEVFTFSTQEGVEVTAVLTDIEENTIQVGLGTSGNPAIDQTTEGIVTLPDTVEAFGQKYVITTIGGYAFRYCNDVTEVRMPATVTHIGRYGFGNMDNLEKAVLPDSLIAMETAAFYRDAKLSELKLNEGLQDIGNYSFSYAAITELEIPKTVTNIGRNSFAACEQLDKVISRIEAAYAFQDGAFVQISSTCGLHVPEGTKEAYIEQGWTEETFPGGIVYGDETLHKGQSFDVTEEDGTLKTFRVTDVNEMKAEMVSVKAGSEAGGTVTLMPTATHELTGNVYTVSSIADKAFGADVKKVLSRIETPFAVSSAAFASLSPMCSLHVPAGTKAAYLEQGWTEESFKAGVVEGDDTLVKGQTFTLTDEDGTSTTYRVTDVNDNLVEIVSAKEGEEADGRVNIQQAVTDPVAGNDYTVGSIGNGAFKEELKAVSAEAETPYPVTPEAFKGIGDKCVLFVPVGTKDAYIENGWTEDIFKGGIYEGNIPGDVNEDLAVDISDIVAVINTIADPENSTYRYADVNEDNKVDISDIVKIINIIAEK